MRGSSGFVKPVLLILLAILVVAVIAFVSAGMMGGDQDLGAAVDFTGVDEKSKTFQLSSCFGTKGTVLIFFDQATSNGKVLLTNVSAITRDNGGVQTVLVAKGATDAKELRKYFNENNFDVDYIVPDPEGKICETYQITTCPVTYFIDSAGSVRGGSLSSLTPSAAKKYVGYIDPAK